MQPATPFFVLKLSLGTHKTPLEALIDLLKQKTMETLKINPLLPANAKQELYDFYQFLVSKYVPEHQTANQTTTQIQSLKGVFNDYADSSKINQESNAWQQHLLDKYKNNNHD